MDYCKPRRSIYALTFIMGIIAALGSLAYLFPHEGREHIRPSQPDIVLDDGFSVRSIQIVAVDPKDTIGALGMLTVRVIPGDSHVLIDTNPYLEPDVQYSTNVAVDVAKEKAHAGDDSDFVFTYDVPGTIVGGGSAGAATALATWAALDGRELREDAVITGSIEPDGTIGPVGGIYEKAKVAAESGNTLFLVPQGQSVTRTYERVAEREPMVFGIRMYSTRYVPKTTDIAAEAKEWGLEVREVENIDEAAKLMFV